MLAFIVMSFVSRIWLQRLIVGLCLILSFASWQASASGQVQLDHTHGIDHSEHQHSDHDGGHDHQGDHHCPNCGVHFVAITAGFFTITSGRLNAYENLLTDRFLPGAEAPPTPPPNL